MPKVGPSKRDPTGLRRQIARENAAADRMARKDENMKKNAGLAQLEEHPPCKREVAGSSPCDRHHSSGGDVSAGSPDGGVVRRCVGWRSGTGA